MLTSLILVLDVKRFHVSFSSTIHLAHMACVSDMWNVFGPFNTHFHFSDSGLVRYLVPWI